MDNVADCIGGYEDWLSVVFGKDQKGSSILMRTSFGRRRSMPSDPGNLLTNMLSVISILTVKAIGA